MNKLVTTLFLMLLPVYLISQTSHEQGFPFLKNYVPSEYRAHAQNFAIVSDRQDMLYFGNFAGILQFDGESWRLIPTTNTTKVSALAIDSSGTIYAGARGEIGFLKPDEYGAFHFCNLKTGSKNVLKPFSDVKQLFATREGVRFISQNTVFTVKKDGNIDSWVAPLEIMGGFYCSGTLYLQLKEEGLVALVGGTIKKFEGGNRLSGAIEIKAIMPYSNDAVLVVTGTQGLFLLQHDQLTEFRTASSSRLQQSLITCGIRLNDGTFALGTSTHGILILDQKGDILQLIDKRAGLRDNSIQALYASSSNIIWAALNNGIAMIQIPSQLTFFDEKSGLNGAVNHVIRFKNTLYVSTYQGLFYYDEQKFTFSPVNEIITACWCVVPYENCLLAATSQGIFSVENKKARLIQEGFALSIASSTVDPATFYIGEMKGFFRLKNAGGRWTCERFEGPEEEINDLQVDGYGNIWGSTLSRGILKYTPGDKAPVFYDHEDGLPEDVGLSLNRINDHMSVATRKGVYIFNEKTKTFDSISLYKSTDPADDQWFSILIPTPQGNLWVNDGEETNIRLLVRNKNQYQPLEKPFLPITDYVIWAVYPEDNGVTWLGGPDGLIRYNPVVTNDYMVPEATLLRKIAIQADSTIFAGSLMNQVKTLKSKIEIKYRYNSLRFEFSLPFYSPRGENLYQYFLEGFDETWSDWGTQSHKEYTNLAGGNYIFHVRAKNVYGNITPETTIAFRILKPWFGTVWAFIMYILVASFIIYLIVIIRNRQLLREKRVLEQRIADRTAEVVQQKEEIVSQSQELANKNDELEKINTAVKSINAEINFENLIQSLLEKMRVIRSIDTSSALVFDKNINAYKFTASIGYELQELASTTLTFAQAENRYLKNTEEVFEDIFIKTDFSGYDESDVLKELKTPKSLLVMVIRVENRVEAFLLFANLSREQAFEPKDISFIKNSKEHIVSAFIRTRIMADLQQTLQNLKDTQDQLVQSEKLASLGQLTAGIAHEIQNPLNFVNNFSALSAELSDELLEFVNGIKDILSPDKYADAEEIIGMIKGNVKKINEHGKRAESIVKGMLQHSRGKTGEFEQVDINNMVAEYANLAYHGMRAKDKSFNTAIRTQLDPEVGKAYIIPQDLSRVILNIVNNACYAVDEKSKKQVPGYAPEVIISTRRIKDKIEITIRDNGTGIPPAVMEKIFNPFFTTKPTGKGTGLGLSMSFDIVNQVHKGKLEVKSQEGAFTEFIITIPEKQT